MDNIISGTLEQINPSTLLCPTDEATFRCADYHNTNQYWNIRSQQGQFIISFSSSRTFIGDLLKGHLGGFPLTVVVSFVNSSSIISTVILTNASHLNGTVITCNQESITLLLDQIGKLGVRVHLLVRYIIMTFRGGGGYPHDVIVQKCMYKPTFLVKIVTLRRGEGAFSSTSK